MVTALTRESPSIKRVPRISRAWRFQTNLSGSLTESKRISSRYNSVISSLPLSSGERDEMGKQCVIFDMAKRSPGMKNFMWKRLRERTTPTDVVMWLIGAAILALVIWGSTATLSEGKYSSSHWFDFIVFGLAQGSIYALIAMGYTMVYGTLRMINFAHSEVFMSGPYTAYFFAAAMNSSGFLNRYPILSLIVIFLV